MAVALGIIALVAYVGMRHGPKWTTTKAVRETIARNEWKPDQ